MVNNAQLDNERQVLNYQVDIYKDDIEEFEENIIRLQRDYKDKSRVCTICLFQFNAGMTAMFLKSEQAQFKMFILFICGIVQNLFRFKQDFYNLS